MYLDFNAYRLEYLVEGAGYYDENGDYQKDEGDWVDAGGCNAVPAGRDNIVPFPNADGQTERYSFLICIKNPRVRAFTYGERLRLTTPNGMEKIDLTVKGFARHQLHCDIYS
jgi:hypothetical protein